VCLKKKGVYVAVFVVVFKLFLLEWKETVSVIRHDFYMFEPQSFFLQLQTTPKTH